MDVRVSADDRDGAVEWTIDGKKPKDSAIDLPPRSGRHTLDFHLDDRTGRGLRFSGDPIWIHENDAGVCPGQGIATGQVRVASVKDKKLSIFNENSGPPRTLQYRLNFEDSSGGQFDLDPVIRNGGGGTT